MAPRHWTAAALAAAVVIPVSAHGATVTGTIKGGKGMSISAIGLDGSATTTKVKSGGKFSLKVPAARARTATLHLIKADGDYFGPVVLATKRSAGYVRITARTKALGTVSRKSGYAIAKGLTKGTDYAIAGAIKVAAKGGKPIGAGKLGLIRTGSTSKAMSSMELARSNQKGDGGGGQQGGGNPTDPCGTAAGGDCDKDGVPNSMDVDDNGNLTIDMTDVASVQTTARLLTYSDVRPSIVDTLNANAGATRAQVNGFLGGTSTTRPIGLQLSFYYGSEDLLGQGGGGTLERVWVTCGTGAVWCAAGAPTATVSGFSEYSQILPDVAPFGSVSWGTYTGSTCGAQRQPCQPTATPSPGNAFMQSAQSGAPAGSTLWTAFTRPNAADTLGTVNADSVLNLNYGGSGIPETQKPIGISPYFVTTPAITTLTTQSGSQELAYPYSENGPGTNGANGFQLGPDGTLALTLWRPQRLALPGESGEWFDVGGLHYGITLDSVRTADNPNGEQRANQEVGCGLTAGSGLTPNSPAMGGLWNTITPLQDITTIDRAPNTANTVSLSSNILQCAQTAFPGVNLTAGSANLSLLAVGEPLAHGANRTGVSFSVRFP